jgi:hypothetical protein
LALFVIDSAVNLIGTGQVYRSYWTLTITLTMGRENERDRRTVQFSEIWPLKPQTKFCERSIEEFFLT